MGRLDAYYEVKLQDTRFFQEISAEERKLGNEEECIKLVSRLSVCNLNLKPFYKVSRPTL